MMRILRSILFAIAGFLVAKRLRRGASTREPSSAEDPRDTRHNELRTFLKRLAMLAPVLAVIGFLVAASGIIPLKASSGHWGITAWFLNFTMDRSVVLHSTGLKAPELDDPVLVLKGAGHYDNGCRPCHGGPTQENPRIPQQMLPHPPYLPSLLDQWEPEELFYIVKHGMKFTGMPAWPAQSRDDEVWAVVAFLLKLRDMDKDEYDALVEGPSDTMPPRETKTAPSTLVEGLIRPQGLATADEVPVAVNDRCGRCHGLEGEGREVGAFPRLAGQRPQYSFASLKAYADGERHSGIMQPIAATLTEEEMRDIAFYYSRMRPPTAAPKVDATTASSSGDDTTTSPSGDDSAASPSGDAATASPSGDDSTAPPSGEDAAAVERGRQIAHHGIPRKRVPSCVDCHGPGAFPRNPFFPNLSGQFAEYLQLQLELFKDDRRGGSVYATLMHPTADDLTEQQMRDVAQYYASLSMDHPP